MRAAVYYETGPPEVFRYEDVPDPDLAYVRERGQRRPAFDHERELLPVLAQPAVPEEVSP